MTETGKRAKGRGSAHRLLRLMVFAALTGACASGQSLPPPLPQAPAQVRPAPTPEEALRERVMRFWKARLEDDLVTQYDVLPPEDKQRVSLTAYIRTRGGIRYLKYEIGGLQIDGSLAKVKVQTSIRLNPSNLPGLVQSEIGRRGPWPYLEEEQWILLKGVWYRPLVQSKPVAPPGEAESP